MGLDLGNHVYEPFLYNLCALIALEGLAQVTLVGI
jgi:hypothetical protein